MNLAIAISRSKKLTIIITVIFLFQTEIYSQSIFENNENKSRNTISSQSDITGENFKSHPKSFYIDTLISSVILGENKFIEIYLPPDYYDDTINYPVFYWLHGLSDTDPPYFAELYGYYISILNAGHINPVIIVKPTGHDDIFYGSCWNNSILYGNYEDYMIQEVIPFIEENYRTISDTDYRALMGVSMGSYGSALLGFKHTDLFFGFAGHAGPLALDTIPISWRPFVLQEHNRTPPYSYSFGDGMYTDVMFTYAGAFSPNLEIEPWYVEYPYDDMGNLVDTVMEKWQEYDVSRLVSEYDPLDSLAIFFSCSDNDGYFHYESNCVFADTLDAYGIDYTFVTTNTGHSYTYNDFLNGLQFLDSVLCMNDTILPFVECPANQADTADISNTYTVIGTEFDPVSYYDNCDLQSVINDFNNNSTLDGAVLLPGTTTITWIITDLAGNEASCSFDIFIHEHIGINALLSEGISVFPNPSKGIFNIELQTGYCQDFELSVMNTLGSVLKNENLSVSKLTNSKLDLSNLTSGIYILNIRGDKVNLSKKIVIQK